jgi:hypothetical protein
MPRERAEGAEGRRMGEAMCLTDEEGVGDRLGARTRERGSACEREGGWER